MGRKEVFLCQNETEPAREARAQVRVEDLAPVVKGHRKERGPAKGVDVVRELAAEEVSPNIV